MSLGEQYKLGFNVKTRKAFTSNQSSSQCRIHILICTKGVCEQTLEKSYHFDYSGAHSAPLPSSSEHIKCSILIKLPLGHRAPSEHWHQKERGQEGNTCVNIWAWRTSATSKKAPLLTFRYKDGYFHVEIYEMGLRTEEGSLQIATVRSLTPSCKQHQPWMPQRWWIPGKVDGWSFRWLLKAEE